MPVNTLSSSSSKIGGSSEEDFKRERERERERERIIKISEEKARREIENVPTLRSTNLTDIL